MTSSEQVKFVSRQFYGLHDKYGNFKVRMNFFWIVMHDDYPMASHATLYALARGALMVDDLAGRVLMAEDLGFSSHFDIANWARENPQYWGNNYGGDMFRGYGEPAFGKECMELYIHDVAHHWDCVAVRLQEDGL